jgi:hypothetical protein
MFDEIGVFWDWCLSVADPGIGMASCACRLSFTKCKVKKKKNHSSSY